MKIKIESFRKWNDITFSLGNEVTKIVGESGKGKSTIFEAIYWCLYGKIQKVSPKGTNIRPTVTIETTIDNHLGQIIRTGQKNVSLIIGDNTYTGDIAQGKIDEYFGTHDLFMMRSYLRAESVHPLINASITEKRELTSLIFPDASKYDKYKKKLLAIRSQDEKALLSLSNDLIKYRSGIDTLINTHDWLKQGIVPEKENINIAEYDEKIKILRSTRDKDAKIYQLYTSLQEQMHSLSPPEDTTQYISDLNIIKDKILQSRIDTMSRETKIEFIKDKISLLDNSLISLQSSLGYQSFDIKECIRLLNVCDELLNIATSETDISNKISHANDQYEQQYKTLLSYEKSIENIEYNKKLETILICPCCNNRLQHTDTLVIYNGDTQPRTIDHHITNRDIQKVRIQLERLDEDKKRLNTLYNRYQDILSKEDTSKGISLQTLDIKTYKPKLQEYHRLHKEKDILEKDLSLISSDNKEYISHEEMKKLNTQCITLENKISHCKNIEYTRDRLNIQLKNLQDTHQWLLDNTEIHIASYTSQIKTLRDDIDRYKEIMNRYHIYNIHKEYSEKILNIENTHTTIQSHIQASHALESLLKEGYNIYVSEKLKELEYLVCQLGKCFFDDSMNITLTSGKESSSGIMHPSFDMTVEYGGIVYDDIKTMSTGERKRLSIILMIALTSYTDGRILLLDEAFSSIGLDMRGIIMNELQELKIPVYITCHDEIPGGYSEELDINNV